MAHIQNAPMHTHESTSKKDLNIVRAPSGSQGELRSEVKEVRVARVEAEALRKSEGSTVAGFPWQFVAVIAVIVFGLLALVISTSIEF